MIGVITKRDILAHPLVTIQCYGWKVFYQSIFARQKVTFLSLLERAQIFSESKHKSKSNPILDDLLKQTIQLELRAKRIYETIAKLFISIPPAKDFFEVLSKQEQDHADILDVCMLTASRNGCDIEDINIWLGYISILETKMSEAETAVHSITCLDDALRLTVQLESSEINKVFQAVLQASNSRFIKKMANFRMATKTHLAYISYKLPELSPYLGETTREFREKLLCAT
jgi:hypothetical protein